MSNQPSAEKTYYRGSDLEINLTLLRDASAAAAGMPVAQDDAIAS